MKGNERRENIINELMNEGSPISAGTLAKKYGVSRQVVVQDVALLRAQGLKIQATPNGYILDSSAQNSRVFKVLFSGHDSSGRMQAYMTNVTLSIRQNLPDYGTQQEEKYILDFIMQGTFNVILKWIDSSFDLPSARLAELIYTMCDSISMAFNEQNKAE